MTCFGRICTIISETLSIPESTIGATTDLTTLDCDSLDFIELNLHIEEIFGLELTNDFIVKHPKVCDIAVYLESRLVA